MEGILEKIFDKLDIMSKDIADMKQDISRLEASQKDIITRLEILEAGQRNLEASQKSLEASQKDIIIRLEKVEAGQKSLEAGQKDIINRLEDLEAGQKIIVDAFGKVQTSMAMVEKHENVLQILSHRQVNLEADLLGIKKAMTA